MHPVRRFVRRLHFRRHDTLRIESAPLHTERPAWAAQAPAQATAAFKRHAHAVGFTEVHSHLATELGHLAEHFGYTLFHGHDDTALAVKTHLKPKATSTQDFTEVEFSFHGSDVTVIMAHWPTNRPTHQAAREALTAKVIAALDKASQGLRLAFYMADCNPHLALSSPASYPRSALDKAGYPLVYEDLSHWPSHIGVNAIGHAKRDGRVEAKSVETFPALGSDHIPAQARYKVKRHHR